MKTTTLPVLAVTLLGAATLPHLLAEVTITVDPTFIKITEGLLVTDVEPTEDSTWWDYDNDGDLDLFLGSNAWQAGDPRCDVFRNGGNGSFGKVFATHVG